MRSYRRIITALLALVLIAFPLSACSGNSTDEDNRPALTVWVLSEDYKTAIERATAASLTSVDWKLDAQVADSEQLSLLLDKNRDSSDPLPDVFMLSPYQLPAFVESGITADLGELGISFDENRYYGYTVAAGTDYEGKLRAACYEPDPGLFFYRRSLAEFYLGTDDPTQVQNMLSDWEGFYETAYELGKASRNNTCMVTGVDELMMAYLADYPLVIGGKLRIGSEAESFMDYCQRMASEGLILNAQQWSEAWIEGMSDPQSVFGYFSSGLGMENILKPCSEGAIAGEGSFGDWAAVPGPAPYNWGGCWLAVHSQTDMPEAAALFIQYFTCEEEAMRTDCLISGSFCANRTVVDQIKFDPQFSESFLSAQNCYNLMSQTADGVSMGNLSKYDAVLRPLFAQCVSDYAFGYSTKEQAIADFERRALSAYPELKRISDDS